MSGRLYVGNLPYAVEEAAIVTFFAGFAISNVKLVIDRLTGRAKGFGFVDIEGNPQAAIDALDGQQLGGRTIKVSIAKDKPRTSSQPLSERKTEPPKDDALWND